MAIYIELNADINEHYQRVKRLADEADDELSEDSLASRAQAMKTYMLMLRELLKMQQEAINLQRIAAIEAALVESAKSTFDEYQLELFLKDVEERLKAIPE